MRFVGVVLEQVLSKPLGGICGFFLRKSSQSLRQNGLKQVDPRVFIGRQIGHDLARANFDFVATMPPETLVF